MESVVQHDFSQKVVAKGTTIDEVMKLLPEQMKVTLSDGKGNQDKDTTSLMVTWATKDGSDYDGDISMEEAYGANLGGIVGTVYGSAGMKRVTSSGSISVKGSFTCGGIAGFMVGAAPEINGCSSDMEITVGGKGSVGGIIAGNTSGRISNAYFNGTCMTQDGVLQSAYGLNLRHATFESCSYAEGSGHNDNGIAGVTCITAQMTQDEVLNALNTEGELPWFAYIDGSPVLIAPPEEAVVTRELGGVLYVQEGSCLVCLSRQSG